MHSFSFITLVLACALGTSAASTSSRRSIAFFQQNGPAAKDLNDKYGSLTVNSTCNNGDIACIGGQFASCWGSSYHVHGCPDGWVCAAIPNERSEGTTTTCVSPKDIAWRFTQAGVSETKRFASLPGACVFSLALTLHASHVLAVALKNINISRKTVLQLKL